jgi:site-specific DNA-methyltransferase (adenine-specific)
MSEPYFQKDSIQIYNIDFLEADCIEEKTIDLVITSPPYNLGIKYHSINDKLPYKDYLHFSEKWLRKCYKLAKEDGRLCLNVPINNVKSEQRSMYVDITTIAKKVGWQYRYTIIWNKQNITLRKAFGSWLSASAPHISTPAEAIVVFYKKRWRKTSGSRKSDIKKAEFLKWTNGLWSFPGEKRVNHPAPFPLELPKRCIKMFSFIGDIVLDPFLGSGTTLVACVLTKRKGIGIEIDEKYCEIAKERLINAFK